MAQQQIAMIPCGGCGTIRAGIPGVVLIERKGLALATAAGQVQVGLAPCLVCLYRVQMILDWFTGH